MTCRAKTFAGRLGTSLLMAAAFSSCYSGGLAQNLVSPNADPRQLAIDAAGNELKVIQYQNSYLRYRVHTQDAKGEQVREVMETKDGTVARVLSRGNSGLTSEADAAERARLQGMLDSRSAFEKHIEKDKTGKKLAVDMIKLMPDAMLFEFVPGQPQREHKPQGTAQEYVVAFKPNPKWNPPTMASQALTGIQGRCWIDAKTHFMTRLEANIFQGINLGFGIFAHIYPGGEFMLEQEQVEGGRWIVDRFMEHLTVRALMVKTVSENADLFAFDFAPIRAMGYQEGIHMLLSMPATARISTSH